MMILRPYNVQSRRITHVSVPQDVMPNHSSAFVLLFQYFFLLLYFFVAETSIENEETIDKIVAHVIWYYYGHY